MELAPAKPSRKSFGLGLTLGLIAGILATTTLGGTAAFFLLKRAVVTARSGWNLVPVVVANKDLPEGTQITEDMLAQRPIPEMFVTSSVVKLEGVPYILDQKLLVPVQKGDPMLWTHFETESSPTALIARHDVASGALLAEADVEERTIPKAVVTESFVLNRDRPHALGRKLIAPFRAGDPILWTHFEVGTPARADR